MALAALFSAFALMASAPPALQLAQADTPPARPAAAAADDSFPSGAPTDDYGFMAWCYGALSGHVDLYEQVLPEVKRIETAFPDPGSSIDKVMSGYAVQHARGKVLLTRYAHALDVQEAKSKSAAVGRADAVAKGRDVWAGSESADPRQLAQLWMSWGLPGQCDVTAKRLAPGKGR